MRIRASFFGKRVCFLKENKDLLTKRFVPISKGKRILSLALGKFDFMNKLFLKILNLSNLVLEKQGI